MSTKELDTKQTANNQIQGVTLWKKVRALPWLGETTNHMSVEGELGRRDKILELGGLRDHTVKDLPGNSKNQI